MLPNSMPAVNSTLLNRCEARWRVRIAKHDFAAAPSAVNVVERRAFYFSPASFVGVVSPLATIAANLFAVRV